MKSSRVLFYLFFTATIVDLIRASKLERDLVSLAQKWDIQDPLFSYESLSFELDFQVSDFILDEMVSYQLFDRRCSEGNNLVSTNSMNSTMIPDNAPAGTGESLRIFKIDVDINSQNIASDSDVYRERIENNQVMATLDFCVRLSLWTKTASPLEVNFREVIVILDVDLTDGFEIGLVQVAAKDRIAKTANQVYEVEAYMCKPITNIPLTPEEMREASYQGQTVRVCVRPEENARNDGIYMRSIDNFVWERDYGGIIGVATQVAVLNGAPADNLLTDLYCTRGDSICAFETLLMAQFYRIAGSVDGSGIASMQFGSSATGRRGLRSQESRNMQDELAAAVAEFELDMEINPRPDRMFSSAFRTKNTITVLTALFSSVLLLCGSI